MRDTLAAKEGSMTDSGSQPGSEPEIPADEPATPTDEPATPTDEPAASAEEPATTASEPESAASEPAGSADEPETPTDEPATSEAEPATAAAEPASSAEEPPTPTAEAATPTDEPASSAEEPAATAAEPGTQTGGHWAAQFGLTLEELPPLPSRRRRWMVFAGVLAVAVIAGALVLVAVSFQGGSSRAPCQITARLAGDTTIPDGTQIAAGTAFVKTWRLQNDGTCPWERGSQMAYGSGDQLGGPSAVDVPSLAVGASVDVSVNLAAPAEAGSYRAIWHLQTSSGIPFGPELHVQIVVPGAGTP
jgi:hypothetical protein